MRQDHEPTSLATRPGDCGRGITWGRNEGVTRRELIHELTKPGMSLDDEVKVVIRSPVLGWIRARTNHYRVFEIVAAGTPPASSCPWLRDSGIIVVEEQIPAERES
jgi:hypothetical protein